MALVQISRNRFVNPEHITLIRHDHDGWQAVAVLPANPGQRHHLTLTAEDVAVLTASNPGKPLAVKPLVAARKALGLAVAALRHLIDRDQHDQQSVDALIACRKAMNALDADIESACVDALQGMARRGEFDGLDGTPAMCEACTVEDDNLPAPPPDYLSDGHDAHETPF